MVLGIGLWWAFDPTRSGMQFVTDVTWMSRFGIGYRVGIDGLSVLLVLLSVIMLPLVVWGSWRGIDQKQRGFYALIMALNTGMLGVFVATDLFLFYMFWEMLLIPMYFMIGIWGSANRIYAATKFVIYTFVGSFMMLVAIIWMVAVVGKATGQYSFAYDNLLDHANLLRPWGGWLFTAFALAFAVKVPLFPFHTWLPDAHTEAPTAGSVDLAVILLKMGTYGFLRFAIPFFPMFALSKTTGMVIATLSVIGIVYAALVAMVQPDLKRLIAYSSVSHLGFVMLGIWGSTVESVQGAIMVMVSHGLSTGALFFMIGMLYERRHTRKIADYGGLARVTPLPRDRVRDHRVLLDRAARAQRLRRRVPRAAGLVRSLSLAGRHRRDCRGVLRGLHAVVDAARVLQSTDQPAERRHRRPQPSRAGGDRTADCGDDLGRPLSRAVAQADRGRRTPLRGDGHAGASTGRLA